MTQSPRLHPAATAEPPRRPLRPPALLTLAALTLAVTACNGLYFGDDPARSVPKQTGPLTAPPPSALNGTARDR